MKTRMLGVVLVVVLLAVPSLASPAKLSGVRDLMDRGCYQAALSELTAIVGKDEENHEAYAMLAECEIVFGDLDAAETAATTALEIVEDGNADYWKLLGEVSFKKGLQAYANQASANVIKSWFADAEVKFRQCEERNPEDPQVRWWFGWAKEWQEYPVEARKAYEEQIAKFPKEPGGYLRLASMLSQAANGTANGYGTEAEKLRADAIQIYTTGNEQAGPDAELLYGKGLALEWQRKTSEAIECYRAAVSADPEYDKAWRRLFDKKQPAADMIALAKKFPNSPTAAMWAAYYLQAESKSEEALAAVLPALKDHGEHAGAFAQGLGAAMSLLKTDQRGGIAALEKLAEYNRFSPDAANNLGMIHRDITGNYPESLKWYLVATERAPDSQDILNDTALIYLFHFSGTEQKKALPMLLKVISLVEEDGLPPERGYWDALENLCKYYWEVERNPELVIKYADMRYRTTAGIEPYDMSPRAGHYKKLAEQAKSGG
jgi:tetratricopeptide (TPR) repeat protein